VADLCKLSWASVGSFSWYAWLTRDVCPLKRGRPITGKLSRASVGSFSWYALLLVYGFPWGGKPNLSYSTLHSSGVECGSIVLDVFLNNKLYSHHESISKNPSCIPSRSSTRATTAPGLRSSSLISTIKGFGGEGRRQKAGAFPITDGPN
jgi:hypothetical protein